MAKTYTGGENDIARDVESIYVGVEGVARRVERAYVGVNGIARRVYPERVYLWNNKYGDNYNITGGWDATFVNQTNGGNNYSMTRMTSAPYNGGYILQGTYSSNDGTSEKGLYARTVKAINFTPYKRLVANMYRNYQRQGNENSAYFGVFNSNSSGTVYCKTQDLTTKFLRYSYHAVTAGQSGFTVTVDVSTLNGSYIFVYDNFTSNMNNNININFSNIWLEY